MLFILSLLILEICLGKYAKNKITLLHTNDIHGHIYSFKPTATHDADFADYNTFILRMKERAEKAGDEVVLAFDSGDLVDGTPLSDISPVFGSYVFDVVSDMAFDVVTIGNHEMHYEHLVDYIADNIGPKMNERYISGNVHHRDESKILAQPYRVINAEGFGKILVLGFLYQYPYGAPNMYVTPVSDVVKETWFIKAVMEDVRLIILVGHMDHNMDEAKTVLTAINELRTDVPVVLLGGHTHLLQSLVDKEKYIIKTQALCYFNLIGIVEIDLGDGDVVNMSSSNLNSKDFSHPQSIVVPNGVWVSENVRFIMTNIETFKNVSGFVGPDSEWMLPVSQQIRKKIMAGLADLHLSDVMGCLPFNMSIFEYWETALKTLKVMVDPISGNSKGMVFVSGFSTTDEWIGEVFLDDLFRLVNMEIKGIRNVSLQDLKEVLYGKKHSYACSNITFDYPYYDIVGVSYIEDVLDDLLAFNPSGNYTIESSGIYNIDTLIFYSTNCLKCDFPTVYDCPVAFGENDYQ